MNGHSGNRKGTITIIGGSGFVGTHLAARLVKDGWRLRIPARHPQRHPMLQVLPGVELVTQQVFSAEALTRLVSGSDAVINLVGILNERRDNGKGFHAAHVELSQHIVHACQNNGITRLLHMSALGADPDGPSHYLQSKGIAENLVHQAEGLAVTSFRPSVIFGPGDSFINRFAGLLRMSPAPFPITCAAARFAPIYVGDVVECFAQALQTPQTIGQRYDLCGPHDYSLHELVHYCADTLGLKRLLIPLGRRSSRLLAEVMEWLPGKPFSRDNFRSMKRDSTCPGPFPEIFAVNRRSLEGVVPGYLLDSTRNRRLHDFRQAARRR